MMRLASALLRSSCPLTFTVGPRSQLFDHCSRLLASQSATDHHIDPTMLQGKQLKAYNIICDHLTSNHSTPLRMVISGTAGTGKSFLIRCLKLRLGNQLQVAAPTGVAAYNVNGHTLHSLLCLPIEEEEYKDLEGERLCRMQQELGGMKYLVIDEMSMVGRKLFGQIDKRLRQVFPHRAAQVLGGCSCMLIGDFGQLPPVRDLPLYSVSEPFFSYTTTSETTSAVSGRNAYQYFDCSVVLDQVMRQSGQNPEQVLFRNILHHLRDGVVTIADWEHLMKQKQLHRNALRLYPTVEAVVEHNLAQLKALNKPIAEIKAINKGLYADMASSHEARGLEPIFYVAKSARVMLTSNLSVKVGLVNGAMGTVVDICYSDVNPSGMPLAIMVRFDSYTGLTFPDNTIPITPIFRKWKKKFNREYSRFQFPLKLAWAVTIHKAQGLTLDKVVIDVGKKEFSSGLTYVACSRVRRLSDLLFDPPLAYNRLACLMWNKDIKERQEEDRRLKTLEPQSHTHSDADSTRNSYTQAPSPIPIPESLSSPSDPIEPLSAHLLQ